MPKSPDAFRTISEVADWLGVQAHVLRFWESKFSQVKPVKRAGGRRYYRPADMLLIGGIKKLLHDDGLTIKGAQKLLREKGVAFVADMSQPLDDLTIAVIESDLEEAPATEEAQSSPEAPLVETEENSEEVTEAAEPTPLEDTSEPELSFNDAEDAAPVATDTALETQDVMSETETSSEDSSEATTALAEASAEEEDFSATPETGEIPAGDPEDTMLGGDSSLENLPPDAAIVAPELESDPETQPVEETAVEESTVVEESFPEPDALPLEEAEPEPEPIMPSFRARARTTDPAPELPVETPEPSQTAPETTPDTTEDETSEHITASAADRVTEPDMDAAPEMVVDADDAPPTQPLKPRAIEIPTVPPLSEIEVAPTLLSTLARVRHVPPTVAREMKPHLARLTRLRASMANPRKEVRED